MPAPHANQPPQSITCAAVPCGSAYSTNARNSARMTAEMAAIVGVKVLRVWEEEEEEERCRSGARIQTWDGGRSSSSDLQQRRSTIGGCCCVCGRNSRTATQLDKLISVPTYRRGGSPAAPPDPQAARSAWTRSLLLQLQLQMMICGKFIGTPKFAVMSHNNHYNGCLESSLMCCRCGGCGGFAVAPCC